MIHPGQDVVVVGGTHSLHEHEKLAVAVAKALRGESLQETKEGRFQVQTRTFLDGAILRDVSDLYLYFLLYDAIWSS